MNQANNGSPLNVTDMISQMQFLLSVADSLSTSRWTQDYSWLYNYDWEKLMTDVFANYNNVSTEAM